MVPAPTVVACAFQHGHLAGHDAAESRNASLRRRARTRWRWFRASPDVVAAKIGDKVGGALPKVHIDTPRIT